jgi:hypothetical protein
MHTRGSDGARWIAITAFTCFWVIWNQWAAFFFWLTDWVTISNKVVFSEFFNLYNVGQWWLVGQHTDPVTHAFVYPFAYPPSSLPFLGFFASFEFGVAAQIWTALSLVAFAAAALSVLFVIDSRRYLFASIASLLIFTSYPLQLELHLGQINLLIASLTILSLVFQRMEHRLASAAVLALGTLLKGPPILFLIYFVAFRKDLRYLVDYFASLLAGFGMSLFVVPIHLYWYWVVNVVPTLFVGSAVEINESVLRPLSHDGLASITPVILVAGVCSYAAFAFYVNTHWVKGLLRHALSADAMFLMNTLVILLLGSRSWPQDYVWVILPSALFLSELITENVKITYFALIGVATFLFNFNTYPIFPYFLGFPVTMIPTGLIGSLLMFSALILYYVRHGAILPGHAHPVESKRRSVVYPLALRRIGNDRR